MRSEDYQDSYGLKLKPPRSKLYALIWRQKRPALLEARVTSRSRYLIEGPSEPFCHDHLFCSFCKTATRGKEPWEHIYWCARVWPQANSWDDAHSLAMQICTRHAARSGLFLGQ